MIDYPALARRVIEIEIGELQRLLERTGAEFTAAVEALRVAADAGRKIIVCGVGKSGLIAAKLAATLTSTGAPAVVMNVQDALHGDLGIVNDGDVLIVMSASGETDEILNLLPHLRRRQSVLISITGGRESSLAKAADPDRLSTYKLWRTETIHVIKPDSKIIDEMIAFCASFSLA